MFSPKLGCCLIVLSYVLYAAAAAAAAAAASVRTGGGGGGGDPLAARYVIQRRAGEAKVGRWVGRQAGGWVACGVRAHVF